MFVWCVYTVGIGCIVGLFRLTNGFKANRMLGILLALFIAMLVAAFLVFVGVPMFVWCVYTLQYLWLPRDPVTSDQSPIAVSFLDMGAAIGTTSMALFGVNLLAVLLPCLEATVLASILCYRKYSLAARECGNHSDFVTLDDALGD